MVVPAFPSPPRAYVPPPPSDQELAAWRETLARRKRLSTPPAPPVIAPPPETKAKPSRAAATPLPALPLRRRGRRAESTEKIDTREDFPRWKKILGEVSEKYEVPADDIVGLSRAVPFMSARREYAFRLRVETSLSYPQIGKRIGGRDHSTVIHEVKTHLRDNPDAMAVWTVQQERLSEARELLAMAALEARVPGPPTILNPTGRVSLAQLAFLHGTTKFHVKGCLAEHDRRAVAP